MGYCRFILSSHRHIQHRTSQILLIFIDFDSFLGAFVVKLTFFGNGVTLELEDIPKKR